MIRILSYCIIICAFFFKLPQIRRIISSGSIKGINQFSAFLEYLTYFNTMAYARHLGLPLAIYGETVLVSVQLAVLLLIILYYDKTYSDRERVLMVVLLSAYSAILWDGSSLSKEAWNIVSGSAMLISLVCRWTQIRTNFCNGSTGELSRGSMFFMWAMSVSRTSIV